MHDIMLKEITDGNSNGIKCGVVGEVGSSWPIEGININADESEKIILKYCD